jgi:IS4 transposase
MCSIILPLEAGAFYIMDRGYLDFARLYTMHQAGAFFVTRAKCNFNARRVYSAGVDKATGVVCDQSMALNGHEGRPRLPRASCAGCDSKIRTTGKTLIFLTNNTALPAPVIAQLYKNRWQVELFFKWIKQHLRIKHFLGNSENAVKTQVWCAIATYVLIAIVKKELQLKSSLYTCLQILSVSVFEKTLISSALQTDDYKTEPLPVANQLILLGF